MAVALLRGENFRLYESLEIRPHPGLNLITGDNAAGKTSLLEALFVAARGRSFRSQNLAELCGARRPNWNVFLETRYLGERHRVGFGWSKEGSEARLDDARDARISDVVRLMPIQVIDPTAHRLMDEGPTYRRSFVDWGVFHVEHEFLKTWRRYQRALKQRNSALRDGLEDRAVQAWDDELVTAGESLGSMRRTHLSSLAPHLAAWSERLLGTNDVHGEWQQGWPDGQSLREVLDRSLAQHRRLGSTIQGPHRAELKIRFKQFRTKGRISRGQQKLLICAMVLAQAELLARSGNPPPILLLDDFASELSPDFQAHLASALADYPGQKFVTAFEKPSIPNFREAALFHVEHGTIRSLGELQ